MEGIRGSQNVKQQGVREMGERGWEMRKKGGGKES